MRATAIVALVFAGLSIFTPIVGVFIAMLCSVMALITFRSQPTLSGVTFGINIINTVFLSPSIYAADFLGADQTAAVRRGLVEGEVSTEQYEVIAGYIGFHLILFVIAIVWRLLRGQPKPAKQDVK